MGFPFSHALLQIFPCFSCLRAPCWTPALAMSRRGESHRARRRQPGAVALLRVEQRFCRTRE